jgi:hypothetical protein
MPHGSTVDWMLDPPWRWLVPLLLVGAGALVSIRLSRTRVAAQREGLRQELTYLHDEQAAVATALGGRVVPHRRFGGWDVPDVELGQAGFTVRTGVEYRFPADPDEARLRRWIRVEPPPPSRWRVRLLGRRARRRLPVRVLDLVVGLEADADGVGLDRSGLLVWLPNAGADPARIRAWIDRTVALAQGLLLAGDTRAR